MTTNKMFDAYLENLGNLFTPTHRFFVFCMSLFFEDDNFKGPNDAYTLINNFPHLTLIHKLCRLSSPVKLKSIRKIMRDDRWW